MTDDIEHIPSPGYEGLRKRKLKASSSERVTIGVDPAKPGSDVTLFVNIGGTRGGKTEAMRKAIDEAFERDPSITHVQWVGRMDERVRHTHKPWKTEDGQIILFGDTAKSAKTGKIYERTPVEDAYEAAMLSFLYRSGLKCPKCKASAGVCLCIP